MVSPQKDNEDLTRKITYNRQSSAYNYKSETHVILYYREISTEIDPGHASPYESNNFPQAHKILVNFDTPAYFPKDFCAHKYNTVKIRKRIRMKNKNKKKC